MIWTPQLLLSGQIFSNDVLMKGPVIFRRFVNIERCKTLFGVAEERSAGTDRRAKKKRKKPALCEVAIFFRFKLPAEESVVSEVRPRALTRRGPRRWRRIAADSGTNLLFPLPPTTLFLLIFKQVL